MEAGERERVILVERETRSAAETEALGRALGARLRAASTWLLMGEMGAGKTVLVRGICRGLGVTGRVRSASFTLVASYRGRLPVHHVDLYRLESEAAVEGLDWGELEADDAVLLVEWGERARHLTRADRFEAELVHLGADRRLVRVAACGGAAELVEPDRVAARPSC